MKLKTMSMIQKMQKGRDTKRLKQQIICLKETEERLAAKLYPLQEDAMALS